MPDSKAGFILSIFMLLLFMPFAHAQDTLKPLRIDIPLQIDGKLDEPVWQEAPYVTGFKTFNPDYGKDMAQKTKVFMAYDRENLYFAFRCFDSEPEKIKASISQRDNIRPDDWVCINLDSFNDHQALYALYINPLGIQADTRFAAGIEDASIDLVWFSAGRIDEKGYTIEVKIPLKSIRFANKNPVEMGVIFERRISRISVQGTYPALNPKEAMAFLTQMKPMVFFDLKHHTIFELLPAVTYSHKKENVEGKLVTDKTSKDFSLTAKYGITSNLIFDGTYNPDFSQVEADAGQVDVNLRYDLFFPEKRPFFHEGSENFRIAAAAASELDPLQSVVHTRTIVDPIVGLKLTGKIGDKNTVASIYAIDQLPGTGPGEEQGNAHFPIFRYKRSLYKDSYIGGIYAGRELKDRFNRVFGFDGQLRLNKSSMLEYHTLLSHTGNDNWLSVEKGHALGFRYSYDTRNVDYGFTLKEISPDFQVDMGYITRTGIFGVTGIFRPKFYPKSKFIRRIDVELFSGQTRDKLSNLWETYNHIDLFYYLGGSLVFAARYSYSTEIFLGQRFKTGGFQVYVGGQVTKQFYFNVLYANVNAVYYSADPYQGRSNVLSANLVYQPSSKLKSEFNFIYSDFFRTSDSARIYDYPLGRGKFTYQLNKYLFFRGILEYNGYRKRLLTDFLASFTYIPGTVIHIGYGSVYDKIRWENGAYLDSSRFLETKRGFFFKASYLWRL
jgi:hypothetical protein